MLAARVDDSRRAQDGEVMGRQTFRSPKKSLRLARSTIVLSRLEGVEALKECVEALLVPLQIAIARVPIESRFSVSVTLNEIERQKGQILRHLARRRAKLKEGL